MFAFFFPYGTDAPIYHFPVITIAMIAINIVAFVLSVMFPESALAYCLAHGDGLHPLQWITSSFMHAGILHLVFNMLSLWVFGLIVEGKIGWWRMLVLYLGIGVVQNAVEQFIMLPATGGCSLGASAIIYGLMAISLLWAPKNDLNCVFVVVIFFIFRPSFFDVQVMVLSGILLGLQTCGLVFTKLAMSSMLLHMMGALIGGAAGLWMLKTNRVDCENWDLFSVLAGKHQMSEAELQALAEKDPAYREAKRQQEIDYRRGILNKIRALVGAGRAKEAYEFYRQKAVALDDWRLPEPDLRGLIAAFHKQALWSESIPAMAELLRNSSRDVTNVRLKLAQILVQKANRPAQAWNVLSKVNPSVVDAKQRDHYAKLKRVIDNSKAENPYDFVDADW